jgi:uncharacterized membrane protein
METVRAGGSARWAGYLLGFALGGFFDGILLHQILQWHHLLSGLDGPAPGDLRAQIMADGLFHGAMYAIAATGLVLLLRRGRLRMADFLIGFGAWHVADAVLFHWTLGLHRIRMDTASPLAWDLAWFLVFGIAFIVAGVILRRIGGPDGPDGARRSRAIPAMLAAAVLAAGAAAAVPMGGSTAAVLFPSGTPARNALAAIAAAEGRAVWSSDTGDLWVVDLEGGGSAWRLYRHGALLVGGGMLPAGCLAWTRPA